MDTNALVLLMVGLIDPNLIGRHKRTSIYTIDDFEKLIYVIKKFENLLVLPNIWTEVDNLLNNFAGHHRYAYIKKIQEVIRISTERYISTVTILDEYHFFLLGVTDSVVLQLAKNADFLVTADSKLADYANSMHISVYDIVAERNKDFR